MTIPGGRPSGRETEKIMSAAVTSVRKSHGSWREQLAAEYEDAQARLNWLIGDEDATEEFI